MDEQFVIGVDLGTSATKAAIFRPDGSFIAEATVDVPLYYPRPGVVEQDNDDFYRSAAHTVRTCLQTSGVDPRRVAAIGFDSQMAGIGTIDEAFRPATRFDSWLDTQCQPYIAYLEQNYGDLITRLTGCPPTCDHGPKILWWKEEQPASYAQIAKFVTPAGYVAGAMAGLPADDAFMDHTFIHFSGLSDAQAGTWSAELCGKLGVDMGKLPRIVAPWEVVGEVNEQAAADFGLAPGVAIVAGAGDTAAGALGAGIVESGMLFDTAGTASVLAGCTDRYVADEKNRALLTMRSAAPGLWHPLAYVAGGGLALRWFRDEFFRRQEGLDPGDDRLYDLMAGEAAAVAPGCEGLYFSPHLGGRVCPASASMRGAWLGFTWGHSRGHFYRAILESIAFEYAYYLQILKSLTPDLRLLETRVIGGGSRSELWNQMKADVLGTPYRRLLKPESATWGAALIAAYGVGLIPDLATAARSAAASDPHLVMPNLALTEVYRPLVAQYTRWQQILSAAFAPSDLSSSAGRP